MSLLDCEFDQVDSLSSFKKLKQLDASGNCAHVASMPAQTRDEFSVLAYACSSCWFAEGIAGNNCGLSARRQLRVLATHRSDGGRRIPEKIVLQCKIVTDEPDRLLFNGKSTDLFPPVVLTPFSLKGKSGSHRVEHKHVDYEAVGGEYLKYASTEWHFEIWRNGVRKPARVCQLRIAIPPEYDESERSRDTRAVESPDSVVLDLDDNDLAGDLRKRVEELSRFGFVIGIDFEEFERRKKKGKAIEIQVIRYCFVENGELLRRLYRFRQENQQPPDELVRSRIEVFSARAIGKRFNVSHNTVLASQVYQYVDAQVLPEVQKSARVSRADFNMAAEIAAIDVQRDRSNDNNDGSARQALIRDIEKSDELQQSVRDALLKMVSDGWDIEIVRQKLSDFLEE